MAFGPRNPGPEKALLREAVLAYEALAETYFFSGHALRTLYAAMSTLNLSERLGPSAELARGCATLSGITGFFRLRKASGHYSARALEILADLDDPAAETWVFTLLGLSKFGEGRWEESRMFLANVVAGGREDRRSPTLAGRRREQLRTSKPAAEIGKSAGRTHRGVRRSQTGQRPEICGDGLSGARLLQSAIGRSRRCRRQPPMDQRRASSAAWGPKSFRTRLDFHAFAATVALERGDFVQGGERGRRRMKAIVEISGKSSVPITYWSMFLVARVFANFWVEATRKAQRSWTPEGHGGGLPRAFQPGLVVSDRSALGRYRPRLPRAASAAALATAARCWRRAAANANRLDMGYEAHLALRALGEEGGGRGREGFPSLLARGREMQVNRTLSSAVSLECLPAF